MHCQICGWNPDEAVPNAEQTTVMVDHYEDEHPEILE